MSRRTVGSSVKAEKKRKIQVPPYDWDMAVCKSQPYCLCTDLTTPYECACWRGLSPSVCCRRCAVRLVPVERYEQWMKRQKHTRKKVLA